MQVGEGQHPKFTRRGSTICSEEVVSLVQAVLGASIKVETIHGKENLKIPAGTQSGTVFTLKGQGAPSVRSEALGDHKVKIVLRTPEKLGKRERELYEELAKEGKIEVEKGGFRLF